MRGHRPLRKQERKNQQGDMQNTAHEAILTSSAVNRADNNHLSLSAYQQVGSDAEARHDYTVFRNCLLQENFVQLQNSLYVHHFPSLAVGEATIMRLRKHIPAGAQVTFFVVTDKQYGMSQMLFT
jgi:CRISPR/Cas system-associated protein endoribonuclease Cas2